MHVTVAICTWNRSNLLDQTLTQMHHLCIPHGVTWELLVVNNNCTDDTATVLRRHAERLPLRQLFEPTQGLSNSRNCAVSNARGQLLLWTDDDVLVDPTWLAEYTQAARDWSQATFFGGGIDPWFVDQPPRSILQNLPTIACAFALNQSPPQVRPLAPHESPFGANMAFRTEVLREYPFNPRLGRVKAGLIGDEEGDVLERMRAAGHSGIWVGTARVKHYIPPERANWSFIWRYYTGMGRSSARWKGVPACATVFGLPRWLVRKYFVHRIRSCVGWTCGADDWPEHYKRAAITLGVLLECRAGRAGASRSMQHSDFGRPYLLPPLPKVSANEGSASPARTGGMTSVANAPRSHATK